MKGEMPVVVALALVLSLILATIYYSTSTLNYVSIPSGSEQAAWSVVGDEIDSIILATLARLSGNASSLFASTFWGNYTEYFSYQSSLVRFNSRARYESYYDPASDRILRCPTSMRWDVVYNYDDYVCYGLCQSNYTSRGFNQSFTRFYNAVNLSAQSVSALLASSLYTTVRNWAGLMNNLGYTVYPSGIIVNASYAATIASDSTTGSSYSRVALRVNVTVDVYNPYLGYKRITRWLEIGYTAVFQQGYWKYDGLYIPVYVTAYVNFNGAPSSYIVNPNSTRLTVYSGSLALMYFAQTSRGNITMSPVAAYYYGNGTTYLVFRIPISPSYYWPWLQEVAVWRYLVLSSAYCDDSYPPPYSLSLPDPQKPALDMLRRKVTVAFLWAGLLGVEIYGFNLLTGLKLVFKYYANTIPPSGDWVDSVPFDLFGDERASFPPGTVV